MKWLIFFVQDDLGRPVMWAAVSRMVVYTRFRSIANHLGCALINIIIIWLRDNKILA